MKKIWNNQTECYKIDLFVDGEYVCSTNWSKTCKGAIATYKTRNPSVIGKVTANFDKQ